jgi:predicted nucleic acid-binding protein
VGNDSRSILFENGSHRAKQQNAVLIGRSGRRHRTSVVSARQSLATARAFQLSAYDAVYLDLARSQRLTLSTLDDRLRAAAIQAGVSLLR